MGDLMFDKKGRLVKPTPLKNGMKRFCFLRAEL